VYHPVSVQVQVLVRASSKKADGGDGAELCTMTKNTEQPGRGGKLEVDGTPGACAVLMELYRTVR